MTQDLAIDIIVPREKPRRWHRVLIERLAAEGYDIAVLHDAAAKPWPGTANALLALERVLLRKPANALSAPLDGIPQTLRHRQPDLRLDLAGNAAATDVPTLTLRFDGAGFDFSAATAIARGRLPTLEAVLDGQALVGQAFPMIDRRETTALGLDDVLARAVTLLASSVRAFAEDRLRPTGSPARAAGDTDFTRAYLSRSLPRLGREAWRRARFRHAHWRVGYRFHDGAGVADTGELGLGWRVLPDVGDRFYADPFPFHWRGRCYLFVEDYVHATGKAVISVVPFDAAGEPQNAQVVLEEPHHLSYPQVFARDDAVWMLPEASAGGRLVLYRAADFPNRWVPEAVLLEGEISDATLLEHGEKLWLFATHRDGFGSTSDTLVVFSACALAGPWKPHARNPILIDRRRARPGGAFVRDQSGRLLLPVQDGTLGYGGGLGLAELLALDDTSVALAEPRAILTDGDWPYPRIHTLNRSGPLEVIDGIAAVTRWPESSRAS
nr:hypothetical protein [uncultured Shinella sp.]